MNQTSRARSHTSHNEPALHLGAFEAQPYGTVRPSCLGISHEAKLHSCSRLNQLLADTQVLHAFYSKYHWTLGGVSYFQIHLLMAKLAGEQSVLINSLARRIQTLGGVAVGDPRHIAEITQIPRAPDGCEGIPAILARLLDAVEMILEDARLAVAKVRGFGDDGTLEVLRSGLIPTDAFHSRILCDILVKYASHPRKREKA